jgi:branched-chain amino acid transport system ATP-binding protein
MALLQVENLTVTYGSIQAVSDVSFQVEEGEIAALIGANGAGKTSTLLAVSGLLKPASGRILFEGQEITNWPAEKIVRLGLIQVPEGRAILSPLTVLENLELGAWVRGAGHRIQHDLDKVFHMFPRLAERRRQAAGTLSGGEQQMLAIGRALMGKPKLLLLDEPSMGLAPVVVSAVFRYIQIIHSEGTSVLLVEQNARQALRLCQSASVLEHGVLTRHGTGAELAADPAVAEAFLGRSTG